MKLYICSDIHGSFPDLKKFLDAHVKEIQSGVARLVLLGDVYNHGPRNPLPAGYAPMQVAEALNAISANIFAVKGNCDSEVDEMISNFKFCTSCSLEVGGHKLVFTHGHKINPDHPAQGLKAGDAVFYGHFHKPSHAEVEGVHYVCVGAIGICPADVKRSYAVVDDGKVSVLPLDGGEQILSFELK